MRTRSFLACALLCAACTRDTSQKPQQQASTTPPAQPTSSAAANLPPAPTPTPTPAPAPPPPPADVPAPEDVATPPKDAVKTDSGLASRVLSKGTGTEHPNAWDTVKVNYTGWHTDGKMFDSSVKHGRPVSFPLTNVIKGWTEGIRLMVVGEKRRFWIPEELAYKGQPEKPQGMLVFDVELLDIKKGPKPVPAPADVAKAPKDAEQASEGVMMRMIKPGKGKHPTDTDLISLQAIQWAQDTGQMNINTRDRGMPETRRLNEFPPMFQTVFKAMLPGETRRVWMSPKALARPGSPEPPTGYTFEFELVEVITPLAADAPELKAPADVAAPPKDAQKAADGLAWKVLAKGTGADKPTLKDVVRVKYTGWQASDGKMVDSTLVSGRPGIFQVTGVMKGWTEALQMMTVGEKRRIWIPEELAYKGQPERPQGMLVFDVELLDIIKQPSNE